MATNLRQGGVEVGISAPDLRVAEPVQSSTAVIANTLGNFVTSAYSEYVKQDALTGAENVNKKLQEDIGAIEAGQNIEEAYSAELQQMANDRPEVKDLIRTLSTSKTASEQRRAARLMHTLRSEAALKSTLAKAPGLRAEVTALAKTTLGFDPSAATVSLLLKALEDKEKQTGQSQAMKDWDKMTDRLSSAGLTMPWTRPEDDDTALKQIRMMTDAYANFQGVEAAIDNINQQKDIQGASLSDQTAELGRSVSVALSSVYTEVQESMLNMVSLIGSEEDLINYKTEVIPQAEALKLRIAQEFDSIVSRANLPAEQRRELVTIKKDLLTDLLSGFDSIIDSDNLMQVQGKVKALQLLQENLKLGAVVNNKTLTKASTLFGDGLLPVLTTFFNSGEGYDTVKKAVDNALVSLSTEDLKAMDLSNYLAVAGDEMPFEDLSADAKKSLAAKTFSASKEVFSKYGTNPQDIPPEAVESIANTMAGATQLSNLYTRDDWKNIAKNNQSPAFSHVVKEMLKKGGDASVKAEILVDSNMVAQKNLIRDITPQKVLEAIGDKTGIHQTLIEFDANTGLFTVKGSSGKEQVLSARGWRTTRGIDSTSESARIVHELNNAIGSIDEFKSHDPSLANLSRTQIAMTVAGRIVNLDNVIKKGTLPELPKASPAPELAPRSTYQDQAKKLSKSLEETRDKVAGDTDVNEILQQLREATELNAQLNTRLSALEAEKNKTKTALADKR